MSWVGAYDKNESVLFDSIGCFHGFAIGSFATISSIKCALSTHYPSLQKKIVILTTNLEIVDSTVRIVLFLFIRSRG